MTDTLPVKFQQGDDEVLEIGPIPASVDSSGAITSFFNAAGYTPTLLIKPEPGANPTTTIVGEMLGDTTVGFTARFQVPNSATAVAAVVWMQAYIVSPVATGSKKSTIKRCPLWIEPV